MYRWRTKTLRRADGTIIQAGMVFEPTEAERRAFADRLERLEDTASLPTPKEGLEPEAGESEVGAVELESSAPEAPVPDRPPGSRGRRR